MNACVCVCVCPCPDVVAIAAVAYLGQAKEEEAVYKKKNTYKIKIMKKQAETSIHFIRFGLNTIRLICRPRPKFQSQFQSQSQSSSILSSVATLAV